MEKKTINGESFLIKEIFDEKGSLIEETRLDLDSVRNGYYKKYFSNGITQCSGFYKNGKKDSVWICNDKNGNIVEERSFFWGKNFGGQKIYDDKNRLRKYEFRNFTEEKTFAAVYDSTGHIVDWNGTPIYCAFTSEKLKLGEMFELLCFFGVPPGMSFDIELKERAMNGSGVIFKQKYGAADVKNLHFGKSISITNKCDVKGDYLWIVHINYYNHEVNRSDSVLVNLTVI